ncbi:hypothetical protein PQ610_01990 [Tardisphaera miroshnichenkoae]
MINSNNPKVKRVMMAMLTDRNCDKIVVMLDADGNGAEEREREFREKQCPKDDKSNPRIFVIAFETEAEEWITASMGKREGKPSHYLHEHENYEKEQLPSQVGRLDFEKLKGLRSFNYFVEAIGDP